MVPILAGSEFEGVEDYTTITYGFVRKSDGLVSGLLSTTPDDV